jgi:hypothetical protein
MLMPAAAEHKGADMVTGACAVRGDHHGRVSRAWPVSSAQPKQLLACVTIVGSAPTRHGSEWQINAGSNINVVLIWIARAR